MKIHRNLRVYRTWMNITWKIEIRKFWNMIFIKFQNDSASSMKILAILKKKIIYPEKIISRPWMLLILVWGEALNKKKLNFFFQKCFNIFVGNFFLSNFFFQNNSNLHERCGIGWIERKIKFYIFPIFIFWVVVTFVL